MDVYWRLVNIPSNGAFSGAIDRYWCNNFKMEIGRLKGTKERVTSHDDKKKNKLLRLRKFFEQLEHG